MSHNTRLKTKVAFKDKILLKEALTSLNVEFLETPPQIQARMIDATKVNHLNAAKGMMQFTWNPSTSSYEPIGDTYGHYDETKDFVNRVSVAYQNKAVSAVLRKNKYSLFSQQSNDGAIQILARKW